MIQDFIYWQIRTRIRHKPFDWLVPLIPPMKFEFTNQMQTLFCKGQLDLSLHKTLDGHINFLPAHVHFSLLPVSVVGQRPDSAHHPVSRLSLVWGRDRYRGSGSRDQLRHPEPGSLIHPRLALIIDRSGQGWSLHYYLTNDLVQIISGITGDYQELSSLTGKIFQMLNIGNSYQEVCGGGFNLYLRHTQHKRQ